MQCVCNLVGKCCGVQLHSSPLSASWPARTADRHHLLCWARFRWRHDIQQRIAHCARNKILLSRAIRVPGRCEVSGWLTSCFLRLRHYRHITALAGHPSTCSQGSGGDLGLGGSCHCDFRRVSSTPTTTVMFVESSVDRSRRQMPFDSTDGVDRRPLTGDSCPGKWTTPVGFFDNRRR